VTTCTRRPVTVDATKPFAARKGGRNGILAFEWLTANSGRFMRVQRSLSAVWGVMFLAYAVLRVVVIYRVSLSEAVWLTEVPGIIAVVICMIASALAGKQLETLVYDRMEQMAGGRASADTRPGPAPVTTVAGDDVADHLEAPERPRQTAAAQVVRGGHGITPDISAL
jgi:hypothetical protein